MTILVLTNSDVSRPLIDWLHAHEARVVVHGQKLELPFLDQCRPDLILSYNYQHIIRKPVLNAYPYIINLHISYLPWNRGAHPNFWAFVDGTQNGVTIHKIDEGLDTGDILAQEVVDFDPQRETFATSYATLHRRIQALCIRHWTDIRDLRITPTAQPPGGTLHKAAQLTEVQRVMPFSWDSNVATFLNEYRRVLG